MKKDVYYKKDLFIFLKIKKFFTQINNNKINNKFVFYD